MPRLLPPTFRRARMISQMGLRHSEGGRKDNALAYHDIRLSVVRQIFIAELR